MRPTVDAASSRSGFGSGPDTSSLDPPRIKLRKHMRQVQVSGWLPQFSGGYPGDHMSSSTGLAPSYLSPKDAAADTALSVRTLRRAIDRGELLAYRVGRQLRIPRTALIAFVEKRAVAACGSHD